jgi:hydroxymethylpyrimidine pyrophosphatase-like HAD family hydrolase
MNLTLSEKFSHTWFIDLDGTVIKHNGTMNQPEELLPGTKEFWNKIPASDVIVITTARQKIFAPRTLKFLEDNNLRYDYAIFDLPQGERIVLNDIKPQGLKTALAVNLDRDAGPDINIELDNTL